MSATAEISDNIATKTTPQVSGLPLIGNTLDMAKDPAKFFVDCYRKHGPVFRINILGKPYKVMGGVEAATFMGTREGKECLRSKEFWQGLVKEFDAHLALPGADGDEHKEMREILRHGYSKDAIKGRYNQLIEITDGSIERDWKIGTKVPVLQAFQFMVTDQLGTILTGRAPLEYVEDIRVTILNILNVLVTRQRPRFLLWNPAYRKAKQRVFELGDKMREEYLANPGARSEENRNLIDDIMQANLNGSHIMPDHNLRLQLVAPYVAGLDTVANTTAAITYTVLKNPDVLARIHEEVDALFADGEIDEAGLMKKIPVLQAAIMETMRLYPIAVAQMRCANKDFVFEGHQFHEGEMIYIATCVPHFMEELYPDPYTFNVDRYEKPRAEHRQTGAYSPYGRGPHTCLGKSLAEVQLALTMARLFYRLDLSLESPDYQLKTKTAPTPGPAMSYKLKVNGYRH